MCEGVADMILDQAEAMSERRPVRCELVIDRAHACASRLEQGTGTHVHRELFFCKRDPECRQARL